MRLAVHNFDLFIRYTYRCLVLTDIVAHIPLVSCFDTDAKCSPNVRTCDILLVVKDRTVTCFIQRNQVNVGQ